MNKKLVLFICLAVVMVFPALGDAATRYVPSRYATIQEAIDAAKEGDTVYLEAGTYEESVVFKSGISLVGESADTVTLSGTGANVIYAQDCESGSVENITLINNGASTTAVYMDYSSIDFSGISAQGFSNVLYYMGKYVSNKNYDAPERVPTVEYCTFDGNVNGIVHYGKYKTVIRYNTFTNNTGNGLQTWYSSAPDVYENHFEGNGYGLYVSNSSAPLITGNSIVGNFKGMVNSWSSYPTIVGNNISENQSHALWAVSYSSPTLKNNIISKNGGEGLYFFFSWPTIVNNTIVGNVSDGVSVRYYGYVKVINNIIAFNGGWGIDTYDELSSSGSASLYYSDIYGNALGEVRPRTRVWWGNKFIDPILKDLEGGDYQLAEGSPCIDAGDPSSAYNDPDGSRNDMGAWGGPDVLPEDEVTIEEQLSKIVSTIIVFPDSDFKNEQPGRKTALENKLDAVLKMLEKASDESELEPRKGYYQGALQKLQNDLLAKCDGHFGGNPNNDWITSYEAQSSVNPLIVGLIGMVQGMLDAM